MVFCFSEVWKNCQISCELCIQLFWISYTLQADHNDYLNLFPSTYTRQDLVTLRLAKIQGFNYVNEQCNITVSIVASVYN